MRDELRAETDMEDLADREHAWFLGIADGGDGRRPQDDFSPFPDVSVRFAYLALDGYGRSRLARHMGVRYPARDLVEEYCTAYELASGEWKPPGSPGPRPRFTAGQAIVTADGRKGVLTGESHPSGHPLARIAGGPPVPVPREFITGQVVHVYGSCQEAWDHTRVTWFRLSDGDVIWVPGERAAGVMWQGAPAEASDALDGAGQALRDGTRAARELQGWPGGTGGPWDARAEQDHARSGFRRDPSRPQKESLLYGDGVDPHDLTDWQLSMEAEGARQHEAWLASPEGRALTAAEAASEDDRLAGLEREQAALGLSLDGTPLTRCGAPAVLRPVRWQWQDLSGTVLHTAPLEDAASPGGRAYPAGVALCDMPGQKPLPLGSPEGEWADAPRCPDCAAAEDSVRPDAGSGRGLAFPHPLQPGPGNTGRPALRGQRPGAVSGPRPGIPGRSTRRPGSS